MNPVQHNILHNAVQPIVVLTLACIIATNRFPNLFPNVSISGALLGGSLATACIIGSTKFVATDESRFMSIVRISGAVALGILCASLIANHTGLSIKLSAKATFRMSIATIISLSPLSLLSAIFTPEKKGEEGDQFLPKKPNLPRETILPLAEDPIPKPTAPEKPPARKKWQPNPKLLSLQQLFDEPKRKEAEWLKKPPYRGTYNPPTFDKDEIEKEVIPKVEAPQSDDGVSRTGQKKSSALATILKKVIDDARLVEEWKVDFEWGDRACRLVKEDSHIGVSKEDIPFQDPIGTSVGVIHEHIRMVRRNSCHWEGAQWVMNEKKAQKEEEFEITEDEDSEEEEFFTGLAARLISWVLPEEGVESE